MRKLALDNDTLMCVEKPERYIGGEINSVMKNKEDMDIRFALAFPDVYEIGMSHLGIQILYDILNEREDTWCERVYSPWTDADNIFREKNIPLFALESQDKLLDFDFIGFTIQYEMCYTNILQILDLAGIPLFANDRGEEFPIIIGGGPCTYNPEPIADFFDLFYIGEGETNLNELMDLYKKFGKSKEKFLLEASKIEGIYVPSLYDVTYNSDNTIKEMIPKGKDVPKVVKRTLVLDMKDAHYPTKPIVPFIKVTQDRVVLEIQRGCIRGCRFCQAGMVYRPSRERDLEDLKRYAREMLENTGHEEISLSSLSSSDYSKLNEIITYLIEEFKDKKINVSLPSLRIDGFSLDVMSKVQDVRKSSLTFAPEAGSQRLRDVINKGLTEEEILDGAFKAFEGGWNKVKLYFMLGLPTETEEDRLAIPHLAEEIAKRYYTIPKDERNGKCQITASSSFFIPKPFTPFQWAKMYPYEKYNDFAYEVKDEFRNMLNRKSLSYKYHDAKTTILEGVFARGDRRLSKVIETAYKEGCLYDAWSEYFNYDAWLDAFAKSDIDYTFYILRERDENEIFPWDFIDIEVKKDYLLKEWKKAKEGVVTPNCKEKCSGCGCLSMGAGVCVKS
ncbi:MAG: TIGR03960 family B12-binding radical SAM protein [Lachnospiraceae bacterium]|jgi:radical SAM family uncharacterized protein|nr:TIGR03960 family B12-binding radical SAM protein [Lachnospiraceae bacterium]